MPCYAPPGPRPSSGASYRMLRQPKRGAASPRAPLFSLGAAGCHAPCDSATEVRSTWGARISDQLLSKYDKRILGAISREAGEWGKAREHIAEGPRSYKGKGGLQLRPKLSRSKPNDILCCAGSLWPQASSSTLRQVRSRGRAALTHTVLPWPYRSPHLIHHSASAGTSEIAMN